MNAAKGSVVLAFVLILALPLIVRWAAPAAGGGGEAAQGRGGDVRRLIVVTPHIEQIRDEFSAGFTRWNARTYPNDPPVVIDWRVPGGTTEILRLLQAVYQAQLKREIADITESRPADLAAQTIDVAAMFPKGSIDFDVMFGGGSYDHTRLKDTRNVNLRVRPFPAGGVREIRLTPPKEGLDPTRLDALREVFTDVQIGDSTLKLHVPTGALAAQGQDAHDVLERLAASKEPITCKAELKNVERDVGVTMSVPAGFSAEQIQTWFGAENVIGPGQLYQDDRKKTGSPDDQQHWLGAALSGFGIVYNRELLREAGIPEPRSFEDICDFRYFRAVAMTDPRQSGSVATLFDSILNQAVFEQVGAVKRSITERKLDPAADKAAIDAELAAATSRGFELGWRTLREMCANAHSFASASTYPPMAVSQGEALAGVCIDFYGRGQAQAVLAPGEAPASGRVGYIDPPGRVFVDADPISILRGGPDPELARRFVEYCMSPEGQALWQFPPTSQPAGKSNPPVKDGAGAQELMGPRISALRRMPARPDMYKEPYKAHFVDDVDPFALASRAPSQRWRDGMITMMGCMGVDNADLLREAWRALHAARGDSTFDPAVLAEMESLFYAMPTHDVVGKDGSRRSLVFSASTYKEISADTNSWRDPVKAAEAKIRYSGFFRENYKRVIELGRGAVAGRMSRSLPGKTAA